MCTHLSLQAKQYLDQFIRFAQLMALCPYCSQWAAPFHLEISLSHGGSGTLSNTQFLGLNQVHNPNDISIGSVVFAGLTIVKD